MHPSESDDTDHVLRRTEASREKTRRKIQGTPLSIAMESAKEAALLLSIASIALYPLSISHKTLILLGCGWSIWKMGATALSGWTRLEQLQSIAQRERGEIARHREEKKRELAAIYRQKGMGAWIDRFVETLAIDDDRLLQAMLEELGLRFRSREHPLKEACGSGMGALFPLLLGGAGIAIGSRGGWIFAMVTTFIGSTLATSIIGGNEKVRALVWSAAVGALASTSIYFLSRMLG